MKKIFAFRTKWHHCAMNISMKILVYLRKTSQDQENLCSCSNKPLHGTTTLMSVGLPFLSTYDYFNWLCLFFFCSFLFPVFIEKFHVANILFFSNAIIDSFFQTCLIISTAWLYISVFSIDLIVPNNTTIFKLRTILLCSSRWLVNDETLSIRMLSTCVCIWKVVRPLKMLHGASPMQLETSEAR